MTHFQLNGFRLHYQVDGPTGAPVLVLSHALGTDLHMWDPQMDALSARFRVVRYDGRGHGASDAPAGPYTVEDLGKDVIALLDALEIERAHICGISIGGMVALWLTAHHPERWARAVFASTAARIGPQEVWDTRIEMVRGGGMKAVSDVFTDRMFSELFRNRRPEAVGRAVRTLESTSPDGYIASCYAIREADLRSVVPNIRIPSLIVAAENDVSTPPPESEWLHAQIPGSKLLVLDRAAHLCSIEEPDRFSKAVLDFLDTQRNERSVSASKETQ